MSVGGAWDNSWLAPLDDSGNRPADSLDNVIGQHSGMYAGLNVQNPQPDFEYSHALNTQQGRLLAQLRGGQVVQAGDPEMPFTADADTARATQLDSAHVFGDVVLIRTPIEKVRLEREQNQRRSHSQLRDSGSDFVDKATGAELDPHYNGGRPTRFKRDDHMVTFEDSDGRTVDQWSPNIGIVREKVHDY